MINTIYYFITRKIINVIIVKIKALWNFLCKCIVSIFKSLVLMTLIFILWTIIITKFRNNIFISDPDAVRVLFVFFYIPMFIATVTRIFLQCDGTYNVDNEPKFIKQFLKDCIRSDSELETKHKEEIMKKKKTKHIKAEQIKTRSEILDL